MPRNDLAQATRDGRMIARKRGTRAASAGGGIAAS